MAVGTPEGRPGPHRVRRALRTALLIAFGALVYWKFDDFIQSRAVQALREPGALWKGASERVQATLADEPPATSPPAYSADSSTLEWTCASGRVDSCISAFAGLGPEEKGRARAAIAKAGLRFAMGDVEGFSLAFTRDADSSQEDFEIEGAAPLRFQRASLRTSKGLFALIPGGDSLSGPCLLREDGRLECVRAPVPRPPIEASAPPTLAPGRPPMAAFPASGRSAVSAILPGKVTSLPTDPSGWMSIHHGDNFFSHYSGLTEVRRGLRAGDRVTPRDTLGYLVPPSPALADSAEAAAAGMNATAAPAPTAGPAAAASQAPMTTIALMLRLEKDGTPLDPMAHLGLAADSAGLHAP